MARRLDHPRICCLARTGVPVHLIAERLKCSVKQVNRVLYEHKIACEPHRWIGTDDEPLLWRMHLKHDSISRVAYCFGVSRQRIYDRITQPRQVSGVV